MKKYIIKQEDSADCGATALLSIIRYYEGYVPLEVIKNDTFTNELGTNFYYLKLASEKYGFHSTGKKVNDLNNLLLPCIAQVNFDNFYHFIVIYEVNENITYMDPAKGIIKLSLQEFKKIFTGYILELIPAGKIIKYEKNNDFKNSLINLYKKHLKVIIILFILAFLIVILSLGTGLNSLFLKNKDLVPLVIIISFSKILISYIKNNIMSHLNKKINISLLTDYLTKIFNLPLKYLQLKKTGDFINRIKDLDNIKNFFSKILLDIFISTFLLILGTIFLFILEFRLTSVLFIITILYFFLLLKLNKKIYQEIILNIESENNLIDRVAEYLNKIKTVKNNKIEYFINNLYLNINDAADKKLFLEKMTNKFDLIGNILEELMLIIIFIYYYHYKFDFSLIITYLTVYGYYLDTVKYYINLFPSIMYFKDVISRIKSIYDLSFNEIKYKVSHNENLYLKNISYSFNDTKPIFKNFNLKIKSGNKVLIKGQNGSGKSTLLDIIYGSITDYQGIVIKNLKISYVSQDSKLFSGTILDNIILNEELNFEKIIKISKLLLLDIVINNKLGGYYSNVSSLNNLSGGESQKIILARGLYQDFDILLLDESLNEIFSEDRKKILNNIFKAYKEKTIICVNHYSDKIKYNQIVDLTARKEQYVNK